MVWFVLLFLIIFLPCLALLLWGMTHLTQDTSTLAPEFYSGGSDGNQPNPSAV